MPIPGALAYFGGHVDPGPGADSFPFWYLEKPAVIKTESLLTLHQPVRARFVVLSFSFCFPWPSKGESLVGLEPTQASCGRVPLGSLAGRILWSVFQKFYEPLANQLGVNQGVRWLAGEGENIVVEVPESKKPKPQVKQSLAARELAEIFLQGQGEVYRDQYVTVSGTLDQVSSRRDDVGLGTSLSDGDDMDEFYLVGLPAEGTRRRVRIRCQIKDSSRVYYLDGKGDLFFDRFRTEWKEVAKKKESDLPGKTAIPVKSVLLDKQGSLDPASDSPVFRKGGEVRFSLGRIESGKIEMEAVTLYDCQKFEVKDSAGNWNVVWEAQSK